MSIKRTVQFWESLSGGRKEKDAASCPKCGMRVYKDRLQLRGKNWHTGCFQCHNCRKLLTVATFREANSEFLCSECFADGFWRTWRSSEVIDPKRLSKKMEAVVMDGQTFRWMNINRSNIDSEDTDDSEDGYTTARQCDSDAQGGDSLYPTMPISSEVRSRSPKFAPEADSLLTSKLEEHSECEVRACKSDLRDASLEERLPIELKVIYADSYSSTDSDSSTESDSTVSKASASDPSSIRSKKRSETFLAPLKPRRDRVSVELVSTRPIVIEKRRIDEINRESGSIRRFDYANSHFIRHKRFPSDHIIVQHPFQSYHSLSSQL